MALIRSFTISGIEVPTAYYVISGLQATKRLVDVIPAVVEDGVEVTPATTVPSQIWMCHIVLSVFKDKAQRDAGNPPIAYLSDVSPSADFTTTFEYDSSTNTLPVVAGYQHLIAQDYFADATVDTAS